MDFKGYSLDKSCEYNMDMKSGYWKWIIMDIFGY